MGVVHPDYLLDVLTEEQLAEWEAYNVLEPFGDWREDSRFAMLCSQITNIALSVWAKPGARMSSPEDFMPRFGEEEEPVVSKEQTVEEMRSILYLVAGKSRKKDSNG